MAQPTTLFSRVSKYALGFALSPPSVAIAVATGAAIWAIADLPGGRAAALIAVIVVAALAFVGVGFAMVRTKNLTQNIQKLNAQVASLEKSRANTAERLNRANRRIDATRRANDRTATLARETGAALRAEIAGSSLPDRDWHPIDPEGVDEPILSIAIPGYNRPEELWNTLESMVRQIEGNFDDRVEVVITDDRSTDKAATEVAHRFARTYPFIGFRLNDENLGLERNLLQCAEPCRGTYLWVFGNDDLLGPDALERLIPDLETDAYDLIVVDKERMGKYGAPIEFRPGTRPIELAAGGSEVFDSILHVGEITGLISTFGWITQVIRRRAPYMAVDPEPFYDTTLHPHLGIMLVAYPRSPVLFRGITGVIHRTQDPRERLSESAGRTEASYMAGGMERDSTWFGIGYAAMLQRVIDRCEIEPQELLAQREALWTDLSLLDWIAENWQYGIDHHLKVADDVSADATRLFSTLGVEVGAK